MKRYCLVILMLALPLVLVSCAYYPYGRYNTQAGAVIGAGTGALIGQAIGGNTESTLIGLAAGTILGALVGNAVDQDYQAARDAAVYNKPIIYYDRNGRAVEAVPAASTDPNCRNITKRIWENGELVKETVEEVCEPPAVRYYAAPPPPPLLIMGGGDGPPVFHSIMGVLTPMAIMAMAITGLARIPIIEAGTAGKD